MKNITMKVSDDHILTITVDLKKEYGRSATGKTIIIASTEGNKSVEDDSKAIVGLNVYKYPPR